MAFAVDLVIHQRRLIRVFTWREVNMILTTEALREAGLTDAEVDVSVNTEDETEGSPPYRIGTRARVEITMDLSTKEPS